MDPPSNPIQDLARHSQNVTCCPVIWLDGEIKKTDEESQTLVFIPHRSNAILTVRVLASSILPRGLVEINQTVESFSVILKIRKSEQITGINAKISHFDEDGLGMSINPELSNATIRIEELPEEWTRAQKDLLRIVMLRHDWVWLPIHEEELDRGVLIVLVEDFQCGFVNGEVEDDQNVGTGNLEGHFLCIPSA